MVRQVGDSCILSIVEKEAMASRTVDGLACEMAHGCHICHENYEFISARGTTPTSAFSRALDLRFRDLDPAVYGGHALRTTISGSIPDFTYVGVASPVPSFATSHGQIFHPGSQRTMARDELI